MTVKFLLCLKNQGYEASLETRKLYQAIDDRQAAEERLVRVIDESGEDYLYPEEYFAPIELPEQLAKALIVRAA